MSDYTDNIHRAYKGKITAYVRVNGSSGDVKVNFSSKNLKPAAVHIEVY
jgi:ribosomal protein L35AE/L33A